MKIQSFQYTQSSETLILKWNIRNVAPISPLIIILTTGKSMRHTESHHLKVHKRFLSRQSLLNIISLFHGLQLYIDWNALNANNSSSILQYLKSNHLFSYWWAKLRLTLECLFLRVRDLNQVSSVLLSEARREGEGVAKRCLLPQNSNSFNTQKPFGDEKNYVQSMIGRFLVNMDK